MVKGPGVGGWSGHALFESGCGGAGPEGSKFTLGGRVAWKRVAGSEGGGGGCRGRRLDWRRGRGRVWKFVQSLNTEWGRVGGVQNRSHKRGHSK